MSDDEPAAFDPYAEMLQGKLARRNLLGLLPQVVDALRLLVRVGRGRFGLVVGAQILVAAGVAAQVLLTKNALDSLLGDAPLLVVLPQLLLIVVINSGASALGAVQSQHQAYLGELVVKDTWQRVLRVAASVPLLTFERSDYYDRLQRIRTNALVKPLQIAQGAIGFVSGVLGIVGLLVALLALQPVVVPVILLAGVPLFLLARWGGRVEFDFALRTTRNQRERFALIELMSDRGPAKEVRAFALHDWLIQRFLARYTDYMAALRTKIDRRIRVAVLSAVVSTALIGLAVAALVVLIGRGNLSLAEAGASIAAALLLGGQLQQLFVGVSSMLEAGLFIRDIEDFERLTDRPPKALERPVLAFDTIELQSVGFSYPGSRGRALHDISTMIRRGETVAVVGANGSGKTTLSKILAHLYTPSEGAVRWDGKDIREADPDDVARSVAVLFQDFVRYELTLHENIAAGDPTDMDNRTRVFDAASVAGAESIVAALPDGFDSMMSTRFPDGVDLSTGQWQRVAMARALFRDAPLVILDEPTAALDPKAEVEMYDAMTRVLTGRTVLLVTHRLASARRADRILVLAGGTIVEQGTHEELIARGGHYREMFELQAAAFRADGSEGA